jgi:Cof subfamily protein (haloacid dehalogenase superfamily)
MTSSTTSPSSSTSLPRIPSTKISAVISDVDGTLVTNDKILTSRARAAVVELHARGIMFSIISSRPPRGVRMLLEPLAITTPLGGFNGGAIVWPDLSIISEHLLMSEAARRAIEMLSARGVDTWVFAGQDWLVRNPDGPCIGREERTVCFPPTVVADFGPALATAGKIVGVSQDFARLARCEQELRAALADQASVALSQPYYLDITHPLANKGVALTQFATLLGIPLAEIAVIGDGHNDVAMFERAGLSIAMGNASAEVQRVADLVTDRNSEDGFANAIERFILGGDRLKTDALGRAGVRAW